MVINSKIGEDPFISTILVTSSLDTYGYHAKYGGKSCGEYAQHKV